MTPDQLALLDRVNRAVNAIDYSEGPIAAEPPDWYSDVPEPGHSWVCRDYVQAKASRLKAAGWPDPDGLLELLCYVETGEHHGVLQVADPAGPAADPYVLDSRQPEIYRRAAPPPGYRWEAVQIAGTARFAALPLPGADASSR